MDAGSYHGPCGQIESLFWFLYFFIPAIFTSVFLYIVFFCTVFYIVFCNLYFLYFCNLNSGLMLLARTPGIDMHSWCWQGIMVLTILTKVLNFFQMLGVLLNNGWTFELRVKYLIMGELLMNLPPITQGLGWRPKNLWPKAQKSLVQWPNYSPGAKSNIVHIAILITKCNFCKFLCSRRIGEFFLCF